MKKLLLILLCLPLFVACGSDDDPTPSLTEKTISYKFNTNTAPTGTNNLIGVQIYKGVKSGDLVQYSPYAYGLFDDFSKVKLDLPKGAEYKIVSTIVIDGKEKLVSDGGAYFKPFTLSNKSAVKLSNSFTLDGSVYLSELSKSTATMMDQSILKSGTDKEIKDYELPPLDRYYGEVTQYNGDSNENPVVDMQRQVFGIRFTVEFEGVRVEPDDCLFMAVKGAPDTLFIYAKDEVKTIEAMYTFPDLTGKAPNSIALDVYHRLPDGTLRRMDGTSGETLYRNQLMILDHKVVRSESEDSYPYKWDAIEDYYGEGGF